MQRSQQNPRTAEHPRRSRTGRPVVFGLLLAVAALLMLAVMVSGPALGATSMVTAAATSGGLIVLAWAVAGPRW